jgi:hypothetical protein
VRADRAGRNVGICSEEQGDLGKLQGSRDKKALLRVISIAMKECFVSVAGPDATPLRVTSLGRRRAALRRANSPRTDGDESGSVKRMKRRDNFLWIDSPAMFSANVPDPRPTARRGAGWSRGRPVRHRR